MCEEKSYLLPIGKEADGATFAEPRHHSHQLFERRIILRHQIVDDRSPAANARDIHLKEIQIQQQLHHVLLPRPASVLVPTQGSQETTAGAEAWHIVRTESKQGFIFSALK